MKINKLEQFNENWNKDLKEVRFEGFEGYFYPSAKGLEEITQLLNTDKEINKLLIDGGFEENDNEDVILNAFAHLEWNKDNWNIIHLNIPQKANS